MSKQENISFENQETEILIDKKAKKQAFFVSVFAVIILFLLEIYLSVKIGAYKNISLNNFYNVFYHIGEPVIRFCIFICSLQFFALLFWKIFKVKKRWGIIYLVSFVFLLAIVFFIRWYDLLIQKDISNITKNLIQENGNMSMEEINKIDVDTETWKKLKKWAEFLQKENRKEVEFFTRYEEKINNKNIRNSKENLIRAYDDLIILIQYTKELRDTIKQKREKTFEKIYWQRWDFSREFWRWSSWYMVASARIKVYEAQKKLYSFYIENFEILKPSNKEEKEHRSVFDQYHALYKNYIDEANRFTILFSKHRESSKKIFNKYLIN